MFDVDNDWIYGKNKNWRKGDGIPVISGITTNNGVNYYTGDIPNDGDSFTDSLTISTRGEYSGTVTYHKGIFVLANNILVMQMNGYTVNQKLFIGSVINKLNYGGYNGYPTKETLKEDHVYLPTKNGNIDYDFMDSFVAELEAQRVAELEAYLETTGLNDYELTDEEKKVLSLSEKTASNEVRHSADNAKNETIKFKDFKITDIFEIKNTKSIIRSKIIPGSGTTPYLTASEQNNSISTYIHCSENMIDKGHCLFIGGKTLVITYQKKDFCSNDSHNLALYYKGNYFLSDKEQLYLCGALNKALLHKYSWDNSISKTKIKNNIIRLPINKQNKIDFDYMEKYITAIEKLIIKNVVEYKDKLIDQTKKLVD